MDLARDSSRVWSIYRLTIITCPNPFCIAVEGYIKRRKISYKASIAFRKAAFGELVTVAESVLELVGGDTEVGTRSFGSSVTATLALAVVVQEPQLQKKL